MSGARPVPPDLPAPARLVVLAPNWLGDLVMALPAIADVRRHFPQTHLVIAARGALASLAGALRDVNGAIGLSAGGGWSALRTIEDDARRLQDGRFDAALLLPNSFHAAWLVSRAGIRHRWGYAADLRRRWLTIAVPRPRGERLHQGEYYQRLTSALGIPPGPLRAEVAVSEPSRAAAAELLRARGWRGEPLVGLAPGAAYGRAKRWPPERAGELAARLSRDAGARAIIVGAPADRPTAEAVRAAAGGLGDGAVPIDLVGQTDLPTLAGVMSHCRAFVSNDSGAMHLAAAVGVPVVAIFGPTREWATAPLDGPRRQPAAIVRTDAWCRPCMLRNCPIDHRCMTGISVDEVQGAVLRVIHAAGERR